MRGLNNWIKGGNSMGQPGYWLYFGYDTEIIWRIKETIRPSWREWDAENKRWWVSELYEKQINDIFPGFLEAVVAQKKLF